jgi:hypothetical protein
MDPHGTIEVGKQYYRRRCLSGVVRLVTALEGGVVHYRVLFGPSLKRTPQGAQKLRKFLEWADGEFVGDDYRRLSGCVIRKTYVVQGVAGLPVFRCGERRARFYLRKGFARLVDADTLRLTDDTTEKKLHALYQGRFSEFFMAVKNDRCVVCGKDHDLTRHHVVPRRQKKKLPLDLRSRLSNVLFVCQECHQRYEGQQLVSDSTDPYVWKDHFVGVMRPAFLPEGWDVVSVKEG